MILALAAAAAFACESPRAIDGDTIACARQKVRLHAINARELAAHPRGTCPADRPCPSMPATWARAELARLLAAGPVTCRPLGTDRYGRTVARCATPTIPDLGCALVKAGAAAEWPKYGKACR